MNIISKELMLRAIEESDVPLLKDLINDPEVEKMVVGWSFPVSTQQQINWIKSLSSDQRNIRYVIDVKDIGAVGIASFTNIDFKNGTATINIKLRKDESIRKKGIGYETISMLIDYGFNQLNLDCLVANILSYNVASQRLFEKCGFVLEGILRKRVFKEGAHQDLLSYSLLRSDNL